ncbi:hypothetical protein KIN20_030409 [Parelaphostrongylus tenuis]|uniref:Uncharacterized protein n=1 Tax=Parelaphostrongylus tenuis TaxID=148309 RepID=A0AAD5R3Q2_PARTN|nr:hypothetical protein KIN20_030409 [Parelaphostrongylus tenuis]
MSTSTPLASITIEAKKAETTTTPSPTTTFGTKKPGTITVETGKRCIVCLLIISLIGKHYFFISGGSEILIRKGQRALGEVHERLKAFLAERNLSLKHVESTSNVTEASSNKESLVCDVCGRVVLLAGAGRRSRRIEMLPLCRQEENLATQKEAVTGIRLVKDLHDFENVNFTKLEEGVTYLVRADCEDGPTDFWMRNWDCIMSVMPEFPPNVVVVLYK